MSNIYERPAFETAVTVKGSLKMKFQVDVTQVIPLLPRKGVDATVSEAQVEANASQYIIHIFLTFALGFYALQIFKWLR